MKVRSRIIAVTTTEKLLIFFSRNKDISKHIAASKIGMSEHVFRNRMRNNSWLPDEIERLNNRVTIERGIEL